jgi:hypothetical protein
VIDPLEDLPPPKVDLPLWPGVAVIVLTDEGAVKRGRRCWKPGVSVGTVLSKHRLHERAWNVQVNGHTIVVFTDELELA